jgi:tetratricopeptide (TPR) repeat protein
VTGVLVAAALIALPALVFVLWPVFRPGDGRTLLAFPPDEREQLTEQKRSALRALRELEFEHGAGHVSDDDYADLRARYEAEAAEILTALDRLAPSRREPTTKAAPRAASRRSAWTHPGALAASGIFLVVFGVGIGIGIVRYTSPDETSGMPSRGAAPGGMAPGGMAGGPETAIPGAGGPMAGATATGPEGKPGPLPPGMLQGMLQAAREALFAGRYSDALSAYQAILKREPNNPDALAHVGLMAAMANHPDKALELFDRALANDPKFPPALLYRGQVLYEVKKDVPAALKTWEQYLEVAPAGQDRDRVMKLVADAKSRGGTSPKR